MFKQQILKPCLDEMRGLWEAGRCQLKAHATNLRLHPVLSGLAWLALALTALGVLLPRGSYLGHVNLPGWAVAGLALAAGCYGLTMLVLLFPAFNTWLRWQLMTSEHEQLHAAMPQLSKVEHRVVRTKANQVLMRRVLLFSSVITALLLLSYLGLFTMLLPMVFTLGGPLILYWLRCSPTTMKEG